MKYFIKLAMSKWEDTVHTLYKTTKQRKDLEGAANIAINAIKSKGVGTAAAKAEQSVSRWDHPEMQSLIAHTRGLEKKVRKAEKSVAKNPWNTQAHDNLTKAKFNLEHESKFYVDSGEARVIGTVRRHAKDRVRPVTGVTVGYSKWNPKLEGLPEPKNLTEAVLG